MNKILLILFSLFLTNIDAVLIKNNSTVNIKVCTFESHSHLANVSVGQTWEKKGVEKLSILYIPKNQPVACQSFCSEDFENLTDDTTINFNCDESTVTQN